MIGRLRQLLRAIDVRLIRGDAPLACRAAPGHRLPGQHPLHGGIGRLGVCAYLTAFLDFSYADRCMRCNFVAPRCTARHSPFPTPRVSRCFFLGAPLAWAAFSLRPTLWMSLLRSGPINQSSLPLATALLSGWFLESFIHFIPLCIRQMVTECQLSAGQRGWSSEGERRFGLIAEMARACPGVWSWVGGFKSDYELTDPEQTN